MKTNNSRHDKQQFREQLQECSKQLVANLQDNNFDSASELIPTLVEARDRHIFQAVGKLTRGLHDAIVNFQVDADLSVTPPDISNSEMRDASERLNYVMDLTQQAADKTMDKVEAAAPIAMNLGEEASALTKDWHRLKKREVTKEEFNDLYNRMGSFLDNMDSGTQSLSAMLQEIILEQGYQDLTGQVLKKVIGLISEVESELVNLMRIAGEVEIVTGLTEQDVKENKQKKKNQYEGEGPQIYADQKSHVVSNQDDVDDLLSSLGF